MGQISLQIPQTGLPNSTEDPKVATDLTTIQTVINGNLDDSNLYSPNNSVRHLLLQSSCMLTGNTPGGTYIPVANGNAVKVGDSVTFAVPQWTSDVGLSSQPQDFVVAHKTTYGRVRCSVTTSGVASGTSFTMSLYPITAIVGTSQAIYTVGSSVAGSSATVTTPGPGTIIGAESTQFALPAAGSTYLICVVASGTLVAGSNVSITSQLYAYNA